MEILIAVLVIVVIGLLVEGRFRRSDYRSDKERRAHELEAMWRVELVAMDVFERQHDLVQRGVITVKDGAVYLTSDKPKRKPAKKAATKKR